MSKKDKENESSSIAQHKREGSVLKPPFAQLGVTTSSWKDDRMPEMLWAVLLIGNLKREDALEIFRGVGKFVEGREDIMDITLSGIATWQQKDRIAFLRFLKDSNLKSAELLRALSIFPSLPIYEDWKNVFGEVTSTTEPESVDALVKGVRAVMWHQSQEATDCRWVKVLALITSGKMKVPHEMASEILNYPNQGDMRAVRPIIRASEIVPSPDKKVTNWPESFWKACLEQTFCSPIPRKEQRKDVISIGHEQVARVRHLLFLHYMKTDDTTSVDSRHDTIFGFGFYALRLINELAVTNLSRGATGRLILRTCVESYITLAYLIVRNDSNLWNEFRDYGIGQMKLAYLKAREANDKPAFIDEEFLKEIANEDRWEEFSNIELTHWASSDLRKMSEDAGVKDVYDAYYNWTSTFSHGSWGAIRESSLAMCANPLHRLHLIPSVIIYPLPGVLEDAVKICNLILGLIESQYPNLNTILVHEPRPAKRRFLRELYYRVVNRKNQKLFDFITTGKR